VVQVDQQQLLSIRYAAPEGPDCARLQSSAVVDARGNEPFWAVEIYEDSARLRVPLSPGGVVFRRGAWRRLSSGEWVFDARRGASGREEVLVVALTESRCIDTMSGARYPFRAALIREGDPARGCAVEGRSARVR
jgi:uncharacterized membrane protein